MSPISKLAHRQRLVPDWRYLPAVLALGAPLALGAVLVPLRSHIAGPALALIMVAVVVLVVIPGRRIAALLAGLSAGAWFDFFLTRPYESFTISRSADIQTTVLLLVVAVGVGELAARERHHRQESETGNDSLAAAQRVSEMVAKGAQAGLVISAVNEALVSLLQLESCRFDPSLAPVTVPFIERPGFVSYSVYRWDTSTQGLPVSEVTLPVTSEGRLLGRFVLQGPLPGVPLEPSLLVVAVVLADLAGVSLGRRGFKRPLAPAS